MKIFKTIVLLLLSILTLQTGYYALLYKAEITTGSFFICLGINLLVFNDGGLEQKSEYYIKIKRYNSKRFCISLLLYV